MLNVHEDNFKKDMSKYIAQAVKKNDAFNVVSKKGNVVVISEEYFKTITESFYISNNPQLKEEILESMSAPREEFFEFDWREKINV